ncbi:MAG TPA: CocE/NonD family hydrolase [Vicinamibacterales bacterium]|nr:CocE/NonD family hydrolase [Vicinamibacterales bacterium]
MKRRLRALVALLAAFVLLDIAAAHDSWTRHIVVERDQPAKMRDGVTLYADVYRPAQEGRFPALLMRTPYNKDGTTQSARLAMTVAAVRRGYVVVVQDTRGQFKSEGTFDPYRQEILDGHDTIEWVARLPWVDGNVGTFGLSYPGAVQWMTAPTRPPHLRAMAPAMTFAHANHFVYHGGIFEADFIEWFLGRQIRERRARRLPLTSSEEIAAAWRRDGQAWMDHRPLRDLPLMHGFPYWREWVDNPIESGYWKPYDIEAQHSMVNVPVLNLSGWNDDPYGQPGAIRNFVGMRARGATQEARDGQRLVMGPWTHGVPTMSRTTYGGVDYGPNAAIDYVDLQLRFFDRWLKKIDEGYSNEAPVKIFVMGENRWRDEKEWPPARTVEEPRYLAPAGTLLRRAAPAEGSASFVYDPARPVAVPQPDDTGTVEWRDVVRSLGVVTFTSEPLERPIEITGHVLARLWVGADVPDTDVTVRLLASRPDGRTRALTNAYGALRTRYRSTEDPQPPRPLTAGEPVELTISVGYTSVVVPAGDRLQAIVTGSMRQGLETHLNTWEPFTAPAQARAATLRVHWGHRFPSRIVLPLIPR